MQQTRLRGFGSFQNRKYICSLFLAATGLLLPHLPAQAQVNGVGQKPYLGWSTFSEQTHKRQFSHAGQHSVAIGCPGSLGASAAWLPIHQYRLGMDVHL